jgi:hypothetical protein
MSRPGKANVLALMFGVRAGQKRALPCELLAMNIQRRVNNR